MTDAFYLHPTSTSQKWFKEAQIPYFKIHKFEIAQRTVSTVETLLGGVNSRQLNQANNLHITYENEDGKEIVLKLEMLTGVTVMGQAGKCNELMDFLRTNSILDKFQSSDTPDNQNINATDEIKKLADLHAQGILTDEEFSAKKKQLLGI